MVADDEEIKLLQAFELEFPSEGTCVSYVRDLLAEAELLFCHHCESVEVEHFDNRIVRCLRCRKESWFTAGTIFERAKKLKPLLAMLWFQQKNLPLSSSRARDLLGIAQSTAWMMTKKIELMLLEDPQVNESQSAFVASEAFSPVIRKRSRETPAREHPRAEMRVFNRGLRSARGIPFDHEQPVPARVSNAVDTPPAASSRASLSGNQERILNVLLEARSAIHIDRLSELTSIASNELFLDLMNLEFAKLVRSESAGRYAVDPSQTAFLNALSNSKHSVSTEALGERIAAFISFCHQRFHGISRKYLQLYLSLFGRTVSNVVVGWDEFTRALLKRAPVHYTDIVGYVSPAAVSLSLQLQ